MLPTYRTVHLAAVEDATRLARLPGMGEVRISPNRIVADAPHVPSPPPAGGRTLLFVGALFYPPNEDAVATSHAVRGLQVEPGRHVLVADRAGLFALHCAALLTDAALAARIADEGERLLRARYCRAPADDTPSPNLAPG
ncbi:hypothetical protein [Ancylobacter sp. FA202]|uniref:hypothetical protein n=1 Tax=Ancylobacter sp. FA202 TaxID=1111106 RepID=UPI000369E1A8|nr:hypothetical protein [Ancylobacter sp. FA202]